MTPSVAIADIQAKFPQAVLEVPAGTDAIAVIRRESILEVCRWLKTHDFDFLMDLTCVDYLQWEEKPSRFEVLYNLFSQRRNERVILKVQVTEKDCSADSVSSVWPAADWYEREVWDMFGVRFNGHPNLKRILMYEAFKGHALRKDYPYNFRQPLVGPQN